MVKQTDFNEEVTKHSVHTLVFRSLKRTHDMFVSDQGNLPDIDKEAEALLWKVKSKSVYGQVQQKVDQVRPYYKDKTVVNFSTNKELFHSYFTHQ